MDSWAPELALSGIVLLGAAVQWLTGMGFALVAVPALVLLLGPAEGVVLANCAAGAISAVGLADGWRRVRLRAMGPLVIACACTVPAGSWVAARLPEAALLSGMGALVTLAVLLVMSGARVPSLQGGHGALLAGGLGGFMNSSAGVGGPPVSLYAVNAGWTASEFVPNALFYGVVVNMFSVAANGVPHLTAADWLMTVGGLTVGALAGKALAARVPDHRARLLVLWLALAGGLTTMGKGLWGT
ncbi:sulfite exporter TauE/SafE family protein [Streptomyces sp. NBC_01795]|nr:MULTISPECIES: sulfite exporter TauE/SafE family protein [unclassified Streptomyces]WSA97038.1 sulfite exporter TauE/SafE family protein [Streptomyces sp. NBC_01795]WSB81463.1 sulfite exporter TauE/SafE family protein [Streptomyces sp. NBC_01775]WSS17778.1 sulfite exporter TauE/SafE family protein [Streptomyces sp. NBC_01186]WSS46527.1 sulfite exporter TauE/SafE family protein [Streptomyces sp. NBC_01187]